MLGIKATLDYELNKIMVTSEVVGQDVTIIHTTNLRMEREEGREREAETPAQL